MVSPQSTDRLEDARSFQSRLQAAHQRKLRGFRVCVRACISSRHARALDRTRRATRIARWAYEVVGPDFCSVFSHHRQVPTFERQISSRGAGCKACRPSRAPESFAYPGGGRSRCSAGRPGSPPAHRVRQRKEASKKVSTSERSEQREMRLRPAEQTQENQLNECRGEGMVCEGSPRAAWVLRRRKGCWCGFEGPAAVTAGGLHPCWPSTEGGTCNYGRPGCRKGSRSRLVHEDPPPSSSHKEAMDAMGTKSAKDVVSAGARSCAVLRR